VGLELTLQQGQLERNDITRASFFGMIWLFDTVSNVYQRLVSDVYFTYMDS